MTPASAGEEADTVSIQCTARSGRLKLSLYVDTRKRSVSIHNDLTGKWDVVDNIWVRLYDDEFQIDEPKGVKHFVFVNRKTGAFRYSRLDLEKARSSKPIGQCEKTAFLLPPPRPAAPPAPPNKF